jgi:hypothetical protein
LTPTIFKTRYPEFLAIADARVALFIADAELEIDFDRWGSWYERGIAALAAHFLAISKATAASGGSLGSLGPVSSRSIGDVSVSFGTASGTVSGLSDDYYKASPYGQEYLRLMSLVGIGAVVV